MHPPASFNRRRPARHAGDRGATPLAGMRRGRIATVRVPGPVLASSAFSMGQRSSESRSGSNMTWGCSVAVSITVFQAVGPGANPGIPISSSCLRMSTADGPALNQEMEVRILPKASFRAPWRNSIRARFKNELMWVRLPPGRLQAGGGAISPVSYAGPIRCDSGACFSRPTSLTARRLAHIEENVVRFHGRALRPHTWLSASTALPTEVPGEAEW